MLYTMMKSFMIDSNDFHKHIVHVIFFDVLKIRLGMFETTVLIYIVNLYDVYIYV